MVFKGLYINMGFLNWVSADISSCDSDVHKVEQAKQALWIEQILCHNIQQMNSVQQELICIWPDTAH